MVRDSRNSLPTCRLEEFWEWRLADSKDREELQEFGWWVKDGKFNDEWLLERLTETLKRTDGATTAERFVLKTLSALVSVYPQLCAEALSSIVRSRHTGRRTLGPSKKVHSVLSTLYANTADEIRNLALNIIDHLTKLGFESYRQILEHATPGWTGGAPDIVRDQ